MDIENKILDSIDLMVSDAIRKASYDKTIQAVIIKCDDPTIGKYLVKYQDSSFYAYATSANVRYSKDSVVYVLIPGNDMSNEKTIVGSVEKLGIDYAVSAQGDEAYGKIGNNVISSTERYKLCSYSPSILELYDREKNINKINFDKSSAEEYLSKASSIVCGASFETSLPLEQRSKGNYGIFFELAFEDNANGDIVLKNYLVDVNQMSGNPYNLQRKTRQYGIFEIDGINFKYVNKIYLFVKNFPKEKQSTKYDIFVSDIELQGADRLSDEILTSSAIYFNTPKGTFFTDKNKETDILPIEAEVRIKGKLINKNTQVLKYYWFKENSDIDNKSLKYNVYGGFGWECLNNFNIINKEENVVEWIPQTNLIEIKKSDLKSMKNLYKCVVVYDETTAIEKTILITDYTSMYNLSIVSDSGTDFYYDIGSPTLTCLINEQDLEEDFSFSWSIDYGNGEFLKLDETLEDNKEYNETFEKYSDLINKIKNEEVMPNISKPKLNEYLTTLKKYDKITRVERNKIYKLLINKISSKATIKCSVYYLNDYIGTTSIEIKNTLIAEGVYNIVLNNGSQIFKYDASGVSPTNESLENPLEIKPLSFTIFDNLGVELDKEIIERCNIEWVVPEENSMIIKNGDLDKPELNYKIRDKYDLRRTNNNIKVIVRYKSLELIAQTAFTFVKDGESGTNGTDFVCKIVPNTNDNSIIYPFVLNGQLNYTPLNANKWFKVELWHSGNKIFSGYNNGKSEENKDVKVEWSILKNKYTNAISDTSSISVEGSSFTYLGYAENAAPANIVKCTLTYDGLTYTSTIPITTAKTISNYKVNLKDFSGFKYAIYSSDGRKPQYDTTSPFEIIVQKLINGTYEDVSTLEKDNKINYQWNVMGELYNSVNKNWDLQYNLKERVTQNLARNQKNYKPIDEFDGECLNNALECILTDKNNNEIGRIHIPVHLYLNKYGNAALNGWDGNSVSIDKDGCGVILAPQIGAGQKENDNSFTGMVMGKVKESGKSDAEVGLFGYSFGNRSLFINSKDGSAIFGKAGKGQIIVDPKSEQALLYSSSYWKNYDESGKPTSYARSNENEQGLLIDLTTPKIKFGNGNFEINSDGHLTAKGGGSIAGWTIGDDKLYKGKVGISSDNSSDDNYAFWAGSSNAASADFNVTFGGKLKAQSGTIGGWTIGTDTLTGGQVTLNKNGSIGGKNWSISAGGYATFTDVYLSNSNTSLSASQKLIDLGNFYVTAGGEMHASNGSISGGMVSSGINAGNITSGSMSASRISGGTLHISTSGGGYLTAGVDTTHVNASGLNITGNGGIAMNGHGMSNVGYLSATNAGNTYVGQTIFNIRIESKSGIMHDFSFVNGILVGWNAN